MISKHEMDQRFKESRDYETIQKFVFTLDKLGIWPKELRRDARETWYYMRFVDREHRRIRELASGKSS